MEHFMPFGSSNGDRKVTSADFARYFGAFIGDGVLVNPSTNLQVLAGSGMAVTLKLGMAFINHGYEYYNDTDTALSIDVADGVLNRKDNIVIRWDINTRTVTALVVKGAPASSATAPALVRTNEQYDLKIAEISIPAGTTAITQGLITDTRANSSVCGYSTGVLQQIDATTLFAQFTDQFNVWFNAMKGQLSSDAAGHLQNEIDTKIDSATIGGTAVPKSGTMLQIPMPTAAQVGAVRELGEITQAILDNPTIGYSYTGSVGPDLTGLPLSKWGTIKCEASGILSHLVVNYGANGNYERYAFGTWGAWAKVGDGCHAASADYASGLNPSAAPCTINTLILQHKTDSIPSGTPANTVVMWKDQT